MSRRSPPIGFPTAACLLAALALLLMVGGCALQEDPSSLQGIMQVDYVISDSKVPPPPAAAWQSLQLPLASRVEDPERAYAVYWLRTHVSKPQQEGLYGLYFYRYTKSLDLYFNGAYLGGDVHEEGWDTVAWNHPLLIAIQNANWQQGDNEVMVRLQGSRLGGVFTGLVFGDYAALQAQRDERWFMQITLNEWLLSFGFLVTALSLLLWVLRRKENLHWKFALVSSCWMLLTWHMIAYRTPVMDRWWLSFVHMVIDAWIYALGLFVAEWFGLHKPRQFAWHRYLVLAAWLWDVMAIQWYWLVTAYLFHTIGVVFVLLLQFDALRSNRQKSGQWPVLVLIVAVQLVCYVHDFYTLLLAPATSWRTAYHWSQFAFPALQLIFLAGLIQRFVSALTFAEGMNLQLETRVATIRGELEQAYQRAGAAERQKAAEDERTRIYRDLHDDVGSKLLSIAHAGRNTRLGGLASSALESLRDAVAKANNPQIRFDELLQQVKEEMQLRLTSLGITLGWWQPTDPLDWMLSSAQNHHLQRIFRELVSNIIRHAGATEVRFDVMRTGRSWRFLLADNGTGLLEQPDGGGGRSLRARALELGATITWHSRAEGGVEVVVMLPLQSVSRTDSAP